LTQLSDEKNVKHEFQSAKNGQAFDQLKLKITL